MKWISLNRAHAYYVTARSAGTAVKDFAFSILYTSEISTQTCQASRFFAAFSRSPGFTSFSSGLILMKKKVKLSKWSGKLTQ